MHKDLIAAAIDAEQANVDRLVHIMNIVILPNVDTLCRLRKIIDSSNDTIIELRKLKDES